MSTAANHPYRSSDPYWLGYLAASISLYLQDSRSQRSELRAALHEFLRSPVASPELRRQLGRGTR